MNIYERLLNFLGLLEQKRIHYTLEHNRDDAVMVLIATPGERWEVEFFTDGHIETEVFRSTGVKGDEDAEAELERFWKENTE